MQGKQREAENERILLEIPPFWPIFSVTTSCRKAVRETLRFPNSKPRATVVLLLMGGEPERWTRPSGLSFTGFIMVQMAMDNVGATGVGGIAITAPSVLPHLQGRIPKNCLASAGLFKSR